MSNTNKHTTQSIFFKEDNVLPDLKEMRSYKQIKLLLSEQLRIILQGLIVLGRKKAEDECKGLMLKLAEDRFTLAVLGQFKRGKSSLMNAIIGKPLLPTGILPLTSAITVLKYGTTERLLVNHHNSMFPSEKPVSAIADYVTETGNPNNQKKVKDVTIELPISFLRYGIEFVDTPGIGSSIISNTETTYNFLPQCDAVLFVTGADAPITNVELQFLEEIKTHVSKIFFVVNKIDLITTDEQNEIINFVTKTISSQLNNDAVKIFPVSSRLALEARINNDATLYEQSGLKNLEGTLISFLSNEKSITFLAAIVQKALKILEEETMQDIFTKEYAQQRAIVLQQEKVKSVHGEPEFASSSILNARTKLQALNKNIHHQLLKDVVHFENIVHVKENEQQISSFIQNKFSSENIKEESNNIFEDLKTKDCPVCNHLAETAFDFFAQWQYKLTTDEQAQNEFAEQLGFCPLHTWQLLSLSSPYGASIGFAKLAEAFAQKLNSFNHFEDGNELKQLVHHSHNCPVCNMLQQEEKKYIEQFSQTINNEDGIKQYQHSNGVCIRHLGMLMDVQENAEIKNMLIAHAVKHFENDAEDMRSFTLKQDALRRALQNTNEKEAYKRTVIHIVGDKRICMPWAEDGEI